MPHVHDDEALRYPSQRDQSAKKAGGRSVCRIDVQQFSKLADFSNFAAVKMAVRSLTRSLKTDCVPKKPAASIAQDAVRFMPDDQRAVAHPLICKRHPGMIGRDQDFPAIGLRIMVEVPDRELTFRA